MLKYLTAGLFLLIFLVSILFFPIAASISDISYLKSSSASHNEILILSKDDTNEGRAGDSVQAQSNEFNPRSYLHARCKEEKINCAILEKIVQCESGWRMVKNPKSSAFGYFRVIDSTEKTTPQYKEGKRKYDPVSNIEMGIWLFKKRGTNPWLMSARCWKNVS